MKSSLIQMDLREVNALSDINGSQLLTYRSNSYKSSIKNKLLSFSKGKIWKDDLFFWPHALLAISLESFHKKTGNHKAFEKLVLYYDKWINKGMPINNLDNAMNGYSLLYIYEKTDNKKYLNAAQNIADYLFTHKTDELGSIPYRENTNVFVDGLGMICPFLSRLTSVVGDDIYIELAKIQLLNFLQYGMDSNSGLPYHAYNYKNQKKYGIIGWGRAVGWLMIGLVDTLEYMDNKDKDYIELLQAYIQISKIVLNYVGDDGYFSWQLSTKEGPVDTSTTSMIAYSLTKGIKLSILEPQEFILFVNKMVQSLERSNKNGKIYDCSAECLGLSMYPQKYGNYPWSQGPTLALFSELL